MTPSLYTVYCPGSGLSDGHILRMDQLVTGKRVRLWLDGIRVAWKADFGLKTAFIWARTGTGPFQ